MHVINVVLHFLSEMGSVLLFYKNSVNFVDKKTESNCNINDRINNDMYDKKKSQGTRDKNVKLELR